MEKLSGSKAAYMKLKLLLSGVRITRIATKNIGKKFKENNYGYNNPNFDLAIESEGIGNVTLPAEIVMGDEIVVAFRYKGDSPCLVDVVPAEEDIFVLKSKNQEHFKISIPPRPEFWKHKTSDGTYMSKIGSVYGLDVLVFFLRNHCEFFDKGLQCAFCNLVPTQQTIGNVLLNKRVDHIREVLDLVKKTDKYLSFCNLVSGSFIDHDKEILEYKRVISALSDQLPNGNLNGYVITMPPRNKNLLDQLYDVGVRKVKMNLEVWEKKLWSSILPGKSRYGHEEFLEALKYGTKVFGEGNVASNIILGIDTPKKTIEGIEFLAHSGIVPEIPILHIDPWTKISPFVSQKTIENYPYFDVYQRFVDILRDYGLTPILSIKSLRSSLSWEAYNGLISYP